MAVLLCRQILRRLPVFEIPKFSQVCSLHGENRFQSANDVEEYRKRQLWLKFHESDIKQEDIFKLSADIQAVNIRQQDRGCFVYVDFPSEEIAEANFTELQKAGMWVNYCGVKRRFNKPTKDPSLAWSKRTPFLDENAEKKLRLRFNTTVTEEEIWQLSRDIKGIKVDNFKEQDSKVVVEFKTEEQVNRHYNLFQMISIREFRAKVYRCSSGQYQDRLPTELIIKDLTEEETEDSLLAEFPGAESVFVFFSLDNKRSAKIKFTDADKCQQAFKKNSMRQNLYMYHNRENRDMDRTSLNKLELRMKLKPWHSKETLRQMFRKAVSFRYYHRLHKNTGTLSKFVFITFANEETCREAFYMYKQFDIQYCFNPEYDYKTLVLNAISDWDTEESLHQLYPDASKIYIHKTVSDSGERTLRNAFLLFDTEEKCKAALEANVKRRLHYRVIR